MSQRNDTHQPAHRAEKTINRANELINNLERAPSILRDLLQENQSLRDQLEEVAERLRDTEAKLTASDAARQKAEDLGRDWERRARNVEQRSSRDDGVRDALRKFGEARVLYYLDVLATRASSDGEPSPQEEIIDGPSLRTLASAIEKWVNGISRSKLSRIFEDAEVTVDRDQIVGLVEFQPSNPFSDEFPRARCRVLSSGWHAGDFIIEKALLEPVEVLSVSLPPSYEEVSTEELSPTSSDDISVLTLEGGLEAPDEQLSTRTSVETLNDEGISIETDDQIEEYPDQPAFQPDSPHLEELNRATAMLEGTLKTEHQRLLWNQFIRAAASEEQLDPKVREELAKWTGGKKPLYKTIVFALNERTNIRELIEGFWSNLVGIREVADQDE